MKKKQYEILKEYSDDYFMHATTFMKTKSDLSTVYKVENDYIITDHIEGSKRIQGPEILYKINKYGFRSKDFDDFDINKKNVLVSGCSISLGAGLPQEYVWYNHLLNNIKFDEYYNLSSMGASYRLIVKNIMTFIRKYGKPDTIFVLFPNFGRDLQFDENSREFVSSVVNHMLLLSEKKYSTNNRYIKNYQYEYSVFSAIEQIRILEDICNYLNIKLIWSSWDENATKVFNKLKFKYYLNNNTFFNFDKNNDIINNDIPYYNYAQDGLHPGYYFNELIGKNFINEYFKKYNK